MNQYKRTLLRAAQHPRVNNCQDDFTSNQGFSVADTVELSLNQALEALKELGASELADQIAENTNLELKYLRS